MTEKKDLSRLQREIDPQLRSLLHQVQAQFLQSSALVQSLRNSLVEAQLKARPVQPNDARFGTTFILNTQGSALEQQTMRYLWEQRLTSMRRQMPVVLFDLNALTKAKGKPLKMEDVCTALVHALEVDKRSVSVKNRPANQKSQSLNSIYNVAYLSDELINRSPYGYTERVLAMLVESNERAGLDTGVAIVYPEQRANTADSLITMLVTSRISILEKVQRNLAIFITRKAYDEYLDQFVSPWILKVDKTQIKALDSEKIDMLAQELYKTLNPDNPYGIRFLALNYGSGKTYAIRKLIALKIPGVNYIDGMKSFSEQKKALNGQVVFIDEPINYEQAELQEIVAAVRQGQGNKVAIFLVPNDQVRNKLVERLR